MHLAAVVEQQPHSCSWLCDKPETALNLHMCDMYRFHWLLVRFVVASKGKVS